ncbi:Holliday junction resolvase RecU [Bulleidia sp. zg-1006]|nr:Holliday junction resolvase RecU [Bulleidia sp. zg-1006]
MMIKYPNGKKISGALETSPHSTSNRGMELESEINRSNEYYLSSKMAVIHKKPTPIQIVKVDYPKRSAVKITEAYFRQASTTDYNGVYRGRYIDFEAKESKNKTCFPLKLVHPHQIRHLKEVLYHGGIGFFIIRWTSLEETYLVPAEKMIHFYQIAMRSSIPYQWFIENALLIQGNYVNPVDYLKVVDQLYFEKR